MSISITSFAAGIRACKQARFLLTTQLAHGARAYTSLARVQPRVALASTQLVRPCQIIRQLGSNAQFEDKPASLTAVLDREIQEEMAELNQRLQSDQFPGFSVETDNADVKLTKQIDDSTVVVRFTVSSSLSEWLPVDSDDKQQPSAEALYTLVSLPDFQVQISRGNRTLEVSCYFEQLEHDEETGEPFSRDPVFSIDEMVMYEGEPSDTEFAVSAEYFREDLQGGLMQFMADHGIDEEFVKNLVSYSTSYEKKQYIGLMKRLREFVSK